MEVQVATRYRVRANKLLERTAYSGRRPLSPAAQRQSWA